ncbi:hypothetical protein MKW92_017225 [Papaver armeniacum]|nr:hypothetical protein MKW92_017225 [Papaver armeniacum]
MATRFRGFVRMLSGAKNSTKKEGSGGMLSSTAQESPKGDYYSERMKEIYGADYAKLSDAEMEKIYTRRVNREFNNNVIEGLFIGLAIGSVYGYFAYGWYPFKVQAMKFKR